MRREGPLYPVGRPRWPWFGGVGVFSGMPMIYLPVGPKHELKSAHDVSDAIAECAGNQSSKPRWVYIDRPDLLSEEFMLVLRHRAQKLVAVETDGSECMCDSQGRLALWDHVVLRVELPLGQIRTELWHSVVVEKIHRDLRHLERFSQWLDKAAYNGPRFVVSAQGAREAVRRLAHSWRLTQPLGAEAAC